MTWGILSRYHDSAGQMVTEGIWHPMTCKVREVDLFSPGFWLLWSMTHPE